MKNILWLRIVLTGLGLEILYALYITFIRWYDSTTFFNLLSINILMLLGGYVVGRKASSKWVLQGALVGVVGALFYIFATFGMVTNGDLAIDLQYILEHFLKIASGALGGYLASRQISKNL